MAASPAQHRRRAHAAAVRSATTPGCCWPESLLLVVALVGAVTLARRTARLSPDFLTEVVLYALSVADLTMLVALVFVLARNVIKLIVERRRAMPFARFRAKLVAMLLGMTLIPSMLVLHRRQRADSQQHRPVVQRADGRSAVVGNRIAGDYYARASAAGLRAGRSHRRRQLGSFDLARRRACARCARVVAPDVNEGRVAAHRGVSRHARRGGPGVAPVLDVAAPSLPPGAVARQRRSPGGARGRRRRRSVICSSRSARAAI